MNKTEYDFHVGDRVIGFGSQDGKDITGITGTIVGENCSDPRRWRVEFDEHVRGFHACGGLAKNGRGWNCRSEVLEPYAEPEDFEAPSLDGFFD